MRERGRQKIVFSVAPFLSSRTTLLRQPCSKPMHGKQRIQAIEEDVVYYEDGADTVKTSVPSPRTLERRLEVEIKNKREVRNAIDQGREDAVKSGVTDIEEFTNTWINTSIAHLDGSQGSPEATMTVPAAASGPKVKDKNLDSIDLDQPKSTYAHHTAPDPPPPRLLPTTMPPPPSTQPHGGEDTARAVSAEQHGDQDDCGYYILNNLEVIDRQLYDVLVQLTHDTVGREVDSEMLSAIEALRESRRNLLDAQKKILKLKRHHGLYPKDGPRMGKAFCSAASSSEAAPAASEAAPAASSSEAAPAASSSEAAPGSGAASRELVVAESE